VFAAVVAQLLGEYRFVEELFQPIGGAVRRVHEDAGVFMGDLKWDSPHCAGDDGFALPERFGHGQAEPFPQRFLDDHLRSPLDGVDLHVAGRGKTEHQDVRVSVRLFPHFRQDLVPLRVVVRRAAHQQQSRIHVGLNLQERLHDTQRILQSVETGDLRHQGFVRRDLQPVQDRADFRVGEITVLVAQRVDGRRDQVLRDGQGLGERGGREDAGVIFFHVGFQESPHAGLRTGQVDVAPP